MEKNPTMLFVVAAALVNQANEILIQKRPAGKAMAGLWEFPGGKVEAGESPVAALIRELDEELAVGVEPENLLPVTFASEALDGAYLVLLLYLCRIWQGQPRAMESTAIEWVTLDEMRARAMPPADAPFIDHLARVI